MDRREALRRLAAAGVVATAGSQVVSTNVVAATCSAPPVAPNNPFSVVNDGGFVRLDETWGASNGAQVVQLAVRIISYGLLGIPRRLLIRNQAGVEVLRGPEGNRYTGPPFPASGFAPAPANSTGLIVSKTNLKNTAPHRLTGGDPFHIEVLVTWQVSGCPTSLVAEYDVRGRGPSNVTVAKL